MKGSLITAVFLVVVALVSGAPDPIAEAGASPKPDPFFYGSSGLGLSLSFGSGLEGGSWGLWGYPYGYYRWPRRGWDGGWGSRR